MRALFDTNILIDLLRGHDVARLEIRRRPASAISIVTRIELLAGPQDGLEKIRDVLEHIETVPIDDDIAEAAAVIRRQDRLKLPDAIILATARVRGLPLLTRNTRDFEGRAGVVIPYRI